MKIFLYLFALKKKLICIKDVSEKFISFQNLITSLNSQFNEIIRIRVRVVFPDAVKMFFTFQVKKKAFRYETEFQIISKYAVKI